MGRGRGDYREKASRIKLVILDVDGVLTDGKIWLGPRAGETKSFNVRDGSALVRARRRGLKTAWVSGRRSRAVERRAEELGIGEIHQGVADKLPVFREIMARAGCRSEETAYFGDDFQDVELFAAVGLGAAASDSHPAAVAAADFVTRCRGGEGAVMEFLEMLMAPGERK